MLTTAGLILAVVSVLALGLPFAVYPVVLWLVGRSRPPVTPPAAPAPEALPRVTIVVAFHGGGSLLARKIGNVASLDYPADRLDLILVSDGPLAPADRDIVTAATGSLTVRLLDRPDAQGKAYALNQGTAEATGDILVFSDLDAALDPDAVRALVRWFAHPDVGCVCGLRVIAGKGGVARAGQSAYIDLDTRIKLLENRLGAITSNDGKLYALRRSLFQPIHPTATDDLYSALTVIGQGFRVIFDPEARAAIPAPSRSLRHDLERRRRVVTRSLSGLLARPGRLLLTRFGLFGPRLVVNKILRRLMPVFLVTLLVGSLLLAPASSWAAVFALMQIGFYGAGALHAVPGGEALAARLPGPARRAWQTVFYVCLGMTGMLLGVVDYLTGKRIARWTPKKTG